MQEKNKAILDFCKEKNIILEEKVLNLFQNLNFEKDAQIFLEKLRSKTSKNFINLNLLKKNLEFIEGLKKELPFLIQIDFPFSKKTPPKKREDFIKEDFPIKVLSASPQNNNKALEVKDFVNHFKNRYKEISNYISDKNSIENLVSIGKINGDKQKFSIIGLVLNKNFSKNKNLILEVEDLTGKIKVIISKDKEELIKEAENIPLDAVLGFKGFGNKEILFVNEIIFPESRLDKRKKSPVEEYALFIGDVHYGSKNFLEKDFSRFIDYLNKEGEEQKKIKYLFIVGDLVTGVGNYPDQELDLSIKDLEDQFMGIAKFLSKIRKDIKIIISPGNHDGVRIMEPQPPFDEKYAWPLYELENAVILSNPSMVNIGSKNEFEGFNVLCYHGFSFPYFANNIPELMAEKSMNKPEKIMEFLLKHRHLAPTHGSTQYFPLEKDGLLIRKSPDIFVSGHTHKSNVYHYNNILIISVSSWEGMTPYQEKFGNTPDHCKVPVFNLKTRAIKFLDFETGEDGIKTYGERLK